MEVLGALSGNLETAGAYLHPLPSSIPSCFLLEWWHDGGNLGPTRWWRNTSKSGSPGTVELPFQPWPLTSALGLNDSLSHLGHCHFEFSVPWSQSPKAGKGHAVFWVLFLFCKYLHLPVLLPLGRSRSFQWTESLEEDRALPPSRGARRIASSHSLHTLPHSQSNWLCLFCYILPIAKQLPYLPLGEMFRQDWLENHGYLFMHSLFLEYTLYAWHWDGHVQNKEPKESAVSCADQITRGTVRSSGFHWGKRVTLWVGYWQTWAYPGGS